MTLAVTWLAILLVATGCTAEATAPAPTSQDTSSPPTGQGTSSPPSWMTESPGTDTAPATFTTAPPADTTTAVSTESGPVTFATLSTAGGMVYGSYTCECCHGSDGGNTNGPALINRTVRLGINNGAVLFDNNAQAMFDWTSGFMPLFDPASLTHEQYVDVICYILVRNSLVVPMTVFNENELKDIPLTPVE